MVTTLSDDVVSCMQQGCWLCTGTQRLTATVLLLIDTMDSAMAPLIPLLAITHSLSFKTNNAIVALLYIVAQPARARKTVKANMLLPIWRAQPVKQSTKCMTETFDTASDIRWRNVVVYVIVARGVSTCRTRVSGQPLRGQCRVGAKRHGLCLPGSCLCTAPCAVHRSSWEAPRGANTHVLYM